MMMEDLSDVKITKTKKVGKIKMTMEMVGEKAHKKMIKTKIFLKKMVGVIKKVAGEMMHKIRKCKMIIKIKLMKLGAIMIPR